MRERRNRERESAMYYGVARRSLLVSVKYDKHSLQLLSHTNLYPYRSLQNLKVLDQKKKTSSLHSLAQTSVTLLKMRSYESYRYSFYANTPNVPGGGCASTSPPPPQVCVKVHCERMRVEAGRPRMGQLQICAFQNTCSKNKPSLF